AGDLVAVAGGDGTVGTVADCLAGRRPAVPIAVLPLGTSNNISKSLGIGETTLDRLVAGWAAARRIGFDAGVVSGPSGKTRFIEGIGVGLIASAIGRPKKDDGFGPGHLDRRDRRIASGVSWIKEKLESFPARSVRLVVDGQDCSG